MAELALRGLWFLFGAFALFSAGLKVRSSSRAGAGVALLTLAEALAGVVLMAATLPGVFSVRVSGIAGLATVGLVLLSTTSHLVRLRGRARAREESASKRLYTSIKYGTHEAAPGGDDEAAPGEKGDGPGDGADTPRLPS